MILRDMEVFKKTKPKAKGNTLPVTDRKPLWKLPGAVSASDFPPLAPATTPDQGLSKKSLVNKSINYDASCAKQSQMDTSTTTKGRARRPLPGGKPSTATATNPSSGKSADTGRVPRKPFVPLPPARPKFARTGRKGNRRRKISLRRLRQGAKLLDLAKMVIPHDTNTQPRPVVEVGEDGVPRRREFKKSPLAQVETYGG